MQKKGGRTQVSHETSYMEKKAWFDLPLLPIRYNTNVENLKVLIPAS